MANNTRDIRLQTNSFSINRLPDKSYDQYSGDFRPVLDARLRIKKVKLLTKMQEIYGSIFTNRILYDGQSIAYVPEGMRPLSGNFYVSLAVDKQGTPLDVGKKGYYEIKMTLTAGDKIYPNRVVSYYAQRDVARATVATNLLQMIFRASVNQNEAQNARAYFLEKGRLPIDGTGLELYRGIFQSVRPVIGKMILTIDTCTAAVHKSGRLLELAFEVLGTQAQDIRRLQLQKRDKDFRILEDFFKKLRVQVTTSSTKSRTKTIYGLVPQAGEYEFEKNGQVTTVKQHYMEAHNTRIQAPLAFGVLLSPKNKEFQDVVPAELVSVLPNQLHKKKLSENLTRAMVKFSTMKPQERLSRITDAANDNTRFQPVRESGVDLARTPMLVNAKIITTPEVQFRQPLKFGNGAWNAVGQNFNEAKSLPFWAVVNFTRIPRSTVDRNMETLATCCMNLGMQVSGPPNHIEGNCNDVFKTLDSLLQNFEAHVKSQRGEVEAARRRLIIIIIVPREGASVRHAVKHWGDVMRGILTQCVKEDKLNFRNQNAANQYWNNIALKVNARRGGINFLCKSIAILELGRSRCIYLGADVAHPMPGMSKPSVASIVYSLDQYGAKYAAVTGIQPARMEKIEQLEQFVYKALDNFGSVTKGPAVRLVFFRDGLSEGEFEATGRAEIKDIESAVEALYTKRNVPKENWPAITYIVVGKRHHTVLFPETPSHGDARTGNALAGSLVDGGITHPVFKDFYLQSHSAIQGTSRSSHYIVLRDDIFQSITRPEKGGLSMIQDMSFSLCHVYAKATRSVSIPAPVYYADLVCARGQFHFHPDASTQLEVDNMSVSSDGAPNPISDITPWLPYFRPIHHDLNNSMYFL
ncbi:hypothetical protein D9613_003305 [Agrocybe pediades]|uniref:Piwi domain-containing protein n=1 Tax=Agrocybe pediades TaxID=84607 RepID=A0A8H4QQL5_9AGAR|nr:hypothetical protein D9613_003305 [Agrocybe pediades]